jgi:hypothetical protein
MSALPGGTFIATRRHFAPVQISEIGAAGTPFAMLLPTATQNLAETHETAASVSPLGAAFAGVATPAAHSTVANMMSPHIRAMIFRIFPSFPS